jgi:uncharacterized protein YjbI with pentapeptide repeats
MANPERTNKVPVLDVHGAFIRRTDWSGANLEGANLSRADCTDALFRDVNFQNARLTGAILRGADLTGAKNLTVRQLASAIVDERTRLPSYIDRRHLLSEIEILRQTEGAHP